MPAGRRRQPLRRARELEALGFLQFALAHAFDAHQVLPTIPVPVLLVGGDRDVWFTQADIEQAAHLIPRCTLKLYPDTTHFGALRSPRFADDVREFVQHHP